MYKKYIHYGSDKFDRDKVTRINNNAIPCKPKFGLWGSPIEPSYKGWKEWCTEEGFRVDSLDKHFTFKLMNNAKVLEVRCPDDISKYNIPEMFMSNIDYDKIIQDGYDAVEVYMNHDLYWYLYGWDCDSIVVLNPYVIVPIEERSGCVVCVVP